MTLLSHPDLPLQSQKEHLLPGLNKALLSIGTLCDHGCEDTFNDKSGCIKNKQSGKIIIRVTWETRKNLCMLNLTEQKKLMTESTTPDEYFAGSAYECKSKITLVDYHQTSYWNPTQSGWGISITKNLFTSWPGLSLNLVHKQLLKKQSTILGHLQQLWKCLISTQEHFIHSEPDPEQDQLPQSTQSEDTNIVFFKTVDLSGGIYTDQTGRFPVTSSKGNNYILVAYNCDSNTIHAEPLKTRSGLDLTTAYQKLHRLLTNRGLRPNLHILDNVCPNVLKIFMREVNKKFKLVPPNSTTKPRRYPRMVHN